MSYEYKEIKPQLLGSEDGLKVVLFIRDRAIFLLAKSGAFKASSVFEEFTGDMWLALAALDLMVELEELHELTDDSVSPGDRVFIEAVWNEIFK